MVAELPRHGDDRHGLHLLIALLLAAAALAAPEIVIEATIGRDLRTITGRMHIGADRPAALVDPLADLPVPRDDLTLFRTFPGAPAQGTVQWERLDEETWWFYAILPRRYGDVGAIRGHGLFANGAWYPQPIGRDGMPVCDWDVTIALPDGVTAAVGDAIGEGIVRWTGEAERVSLSAIRNGRITPVVEESLQLMVLTRGRPRKRLLRELATNLDAARPVAESWRGVVVEAPLRRRLARSGVGQAYVSDRAFAVTPGLERFHRVAVTREVVESLLPIADPFERDLVGAAIGWRYANALAGPDAQRVLGLGAWMPGIHALLYDRRMAFVGDVLEEVHPADPIADDLVERFDPHTPGTVVIAQIEDGWGSIAVHALTHELLQGESLPKAAELAAIPPEWLLARRGPYPVQDYSLDMRGVQVRVLRNAAPDAYEEPVVLLAGERREVWTAGPGPDVYEDVWTDVGAVVIDPDRHLAQTSRLGDRWPPRWLPTFAGWIDTVNVQDRYAEAGLYASLRRSDDTRNLWTGVLYTDQQTLAGAQLAYVRKAGPRLDGLDHAHRFTFAIGPALLDPRFREVDDDGRVVLGASAGWSYDDRVDWIFPIEGRRFSIGVDGGFVPGTEQRWAALRTSATGILSPHPRHAFAGNVQVGIARGDVDHRLLPLGGEGGLRSIPAALVVGTERTLVRAEYRVAPIRNANIPLLLLFGRELQLSGGVELGTAWEGGQPRTAAGATAGTSVTGDWLGFDTAMMGITAGVPLWTEGFVIDEAKAHPVEWHLRWAQEF